MKAGADPARGPKAGASTHSPAQTRHGASGFPPWPWACEPHTGRGRPRITSHQCEGRGGAWGCHAAGSRGGHARWMIRTGHTRGGLREASRNPSGIRLNGIGLHCCSPPVASRGRTWILGPGHTETWPSRPRCCRGARRQTAPWMPSHGPGSYPSPSSAFPCWPGAGLWAGRMAGCQGQLADHQHPWVQPRCQGQQVDLGAPCWRQPGPSQGPGEPLLASWAGLLAGGPCGHSAPSRSGEPCPVGSWPSTPGRLLLAMPLGLAEGWDPPGQGHCVLLPQEDTSGQSEPSCHCPLGWQDWTALQGLWLPGRKG